MRRGPRGASNDLRNESHDLPGLVRVVGERLGESRAISYDGPLAKRPPRYRSQYVLEDSVDAAMFGFRNRSEVLTFCWNQPEMNRNSENAAR